jgi:hypothetical protein
MPPGDSSDQEGDYQQGEIDADLYEGHSPVTGAEDKTQRSQNRPQDGPERKQKYRLRAEPCPK